MGKVLRAAPLVVLSALIIAVPSAWAIWVQGGVPLCTAAGNQLYPSLTSDGAGGTIVTWADSRAGNNRIYAQRLNASGAVQWTTDGVALCTAAHDRYAPQIVSDGAGGAIVTWFDLRSGNFDVYAQKVDSSGVVQWMTDGVALCTAPENQVNPTIVSDGAGGAIVTWQDWRSGNYDIYTQWVNASGALQWTADGVALCMAVNDQSYPTIVSDGAGGAIVAWYDNRSGNKWHIYAQKVDASGAVQWTTDGVAICTATGDEYAAPIVSDGAGGAIFACEDYRGGDWNIYAQKVDASGAVLWTADGVAICTAPGDQVVPAIASDDAGGAIITWQDRRSGNYEIYAQGVSSSGVVEWTADGVALCTATGNQWYPAIASDGAGGAIVTWFDARNGNYDIYAQKVNASGAVQGKTDGVALCTAPGDQKFPAVIADGAGGAIFAWSDSRGGIDHDIYALRVDADGFSPVTAADAPAAPVELRQNYPNPFNPATTVTYSVSERCEVTLKIYDISGKRVASLVDRQQEKGSYVVRWNGKDERGSSLASGIYLYRLAAGNRTISKKMVLLR
ncbi:MAG: T9SS type A sorting domain-containing protein [Candidatus Krumholzibacteriaceae bacterium]